MNVPVIDEVPVNLILEELTPERFLRHSNRGGNDLYVVNAHNAPNTMREIGRLREIAFRMGGGGTGKACDIDEFDVMTPPLQQLIVWNPTEQRIIGGYRFILGKDIKVLEDGSPRIATAHMFRFSEEYMRDYMPYTIELGRSFVRIESQATRSSSNIFALDNLWDGIGALIVENPDMKYLFGKVTMYPSYDPVCHDLIFRFFEHYFVDKAELVRPIRPLAPKTDGREVAEVFPISGDFREDYRMLNTLVRERGSNIPPLVNAYMKLSETMKYFGTGINDEFGDVEETGILVTIADMSKDITRRHIESYTEESRTL